MVELTTRAQVVNNAAQVALLCGFVGGFSSLAFGKVFPPIILVGLVVAALSMWRLMRSMKLRPAKVTVDAAGVSFDGALVVPKSAIAGARYVPASKHGPHVVVTGAKTAMIAVQSAEEATQVIDALGMGVGTHAAKFNVVAQSALPVFGGMAFGLGLMMLGLFTGLVPLAILGPALALLAPILFVPATVHVGTDGILWKSRFRADLFPFERVRSVAPTKRGILIQLTDGKTVNLPMTSRYSLVGYELDEQVALLQRIHEARTRRDLAPTEEATVGWRLDRGERTIADWLASFDAEGAAFRDAAIRLEDLLEVLDDRSRAPAKERVAAAVLLAKRGGDEEKARIRVAAEAAAAPKLRVALDAIAAGKDAAALEEAIREAEEEDAAARRASRG